MVWKKLSHLDAHIYLIVICPVPRNKGFYLGMSRKCVNTKYSSTLDITCSKFFTIPCHASELKSIELTSLEFLAAFHVSSHNSASFTFATTC